VTNITMDGAAAYRLSIADQIGHFFSRLKWKFFPGKSGLESFAERELSRLLGDPDGDGMQREMNKHLLRMVRTFAREGHSGFSAGYAVSILQKLLRYEPIGPLTGDADEWIDVSEMSGGPMWQNTRCSRVFKGADGRAYDIDGRVFMEPSGVSFTGRGSCVYVTFPYTPHTEYVRVGEDGEPLEGPSREELANQ
jgi:hypothetical protein